MDLHGRRNACFCSCVPRMMDAGGKWDPYTDTPTSDAPWFNFNSFGAGEWLMWRLCSTHVVDAYHTPVSVGTALLATFNIITGSLDDTMYYAMWTTSGAAAIYYILATIIGQW